MISNQLPAGRQSIYSKGGKMNILNTYIGSWIMFGAVFYSIFEREQNRKYRLWILGWIGLIILTLLLRLGLISLVIFLVPQMTIFVTILYNGVKWEHDLNDLKYKGRA
jgi:hypothetical protein